MPCTTIFPHNCHSHTHSALPGGITSLLSGLGTSRVHSHQSILTRDRGSPKKSINSQRVFLVKNWECPPYKAISVFPSPLRYSHIPPCPPLLPNFLMIGHKIYCWGHLALIVFWKSLQKIFRKKGVILHFSEVEIVPNFLWEEKRHMVSAYQGAPGVNGVSMSYVILYRQSQEYKYS